MISGKKQTTLSDYLSEPEQFPNAQLRVSEEKDGEKSIEISSLPRKKKQVKIQTANGSVFTMLFVQKRKKWLPVDLPIEQPNQSVVVQRPATYYMSADGVLCTNEGKKLGEAAVSYYVDTHKRKIEQKKTAEINVFYPLENEIDEGAAIAYAEKKKTKEVEKQRFATDKKMILLIEAMRNKHHDKNRFRHPITFSFGTRSAAIARFSCFSAFVKSLTFSSFLWQSCCALDFLHTSITRVCQSICLLCPPNSAFLKQLKVMLFPIAKICTNHFSGLLIYDYLAF